MVSPMKIETVLKKLNLEYPWELLLYLPESYNDYRNVVYDFNPYMLPDGCEGTYIGRCASSTIETQWKNGRPRVPLSLFDGENYVRFTLFGDQRAFVAALEKEPNMRLCVHGVVNRFNGKLYLNNAKVIDEDDAGTVQAVYPSVKGKVSGKVIADAINDSFSSENSELAAAHIIERMRENIPEAKLERLLESASLSLADAITEIHFPSNHDTLEEAMRLVRRCGVAVVAAEAGKGRKVGNAEVQPLHGALIQKIVAAIPFPLTDEQMYAVDYATSKMQQGIRFDGLLIGDVGTGKTAVFSAISAYVASAGGRVAILLPNENLARQVFAEFASYYPSLEPLLCLGNTDKRQNLLQSRVLIGTTALLFRDVGQFRLVVVDEEHKLGVEQREQLISADTHTLNVSATPIPRSYARAQFGAVDILTLKKAHLEKEITTEIVTAERGDWLMSQVIETLNSNAKVLVVCPMRNEKDKESDMFSVERIGYALECQFPGSVRLVHSGLSSEDNEKSLQDVKSGQANILVSTVAIEVGVTIPELRHVIIYGADRFGLVTMHQLRGRLARTKPVQQGRNWGKCHLFLAKEKVAEQTMERLQIMVEHNDGFEIAQRDLELRGCGDINISDGARQHGATSVFIQNITIGIDEIAKAVEWLSR